MDSITFDLGDITIQLCGGDACFWIGGIDHEADIVLPLDKLQDALSAARMLRKSHE
jgi:hypothetical protein